MGLTKTELRPVILLLLLLVSCGGKTAPGGQPGADASGASTCLASSAKFSSTEAVDLARCRGGLPSGAILYGVTVQEQVDNAGSGSKWALQWIASGSAYVQTVTDTASTVAPNGMVGVGKAGQCNNEVSKAASSNAIIPDAVARAGAQGLNLTGTVVLYFNAWADCPALSLKEGINAWVVLQRSSHSTEATQWFDFRYDAAGHFERLCGPCNNEFDAACSACTGI